MRQNSIHAEPLRRFRVTTDTFTQRVDSAHALPVAENLLDQQFGTQAAHTRWSCDSTYLWTSQGWLYLWVVLALFCRKVAGWSRQSSLGRELVVDALERALSGRRPQGGLPCHSERGSQYASLDYQALLKGAGITCSMRREGNCRDNAPVGSFFWTLKRELVHRRQYRTGEQARADVLRDIAIW